jgi:hypothetical protein
MTGKNHRIPPCRRWCFAALGLCVAGIIPAAVAVDTYSIEGHVVSSGGLQSDSNSCFTLAATVGQPVSGGPVNGGGYVLFAGIWRAYPLVQDGVFKTGFENCGP